MEASGIQLIIHTSICLRINPLAWNSCLHCLHLLLFLVVHCVLFIDGFHYQLVRFKKYVAHAGLVFKYMTIVSPDIHTDYVAK